MKKNVYLKKIEENKHEKDYREGKRREGALLLKIFLYQDASFL